MAYTYSVMHLDRTTNNLKYKYGVNFTPTEITYHQTSNLSPAINERNYLNTRNDNAYVSFHIVVDESQAIECLPLNVTGWHSGDGSNGSGNKKSIGVEIARSTNVSLNLRDQAIDNGAMVIANLMKQFNIPMSKVKSHNQRSGKNCPHDIRGRYGEDKFRNLIQKYYNELTSSTVTQPTQPVEKPTSNNSKFKVGEYNAYVETTDSLNIRKTRNPSSTIVGTLPKGTKVKVAYIMYQDNSTVVKFDLWGSIYSSYGDGFINMNYVNESQTDAPSSNVSYTVKILTSSLNIRKEASFDSAIVGTISKGGVYTIVEEKNGLGKLKSGQGWISLGSAYVQKLD